MSSISELKINKLEILFNNEKQNEFIDELLTSPSIQRNLKELQIRFVLKHSLEFLVDNWGRYHNFNQLETVNFFCLVDNNEIMWNKVRTQMKKYFTIVTIMSGETICKY